MKNIRCQNAEEKTPETNKKQVQTLLHPYQSRNDP